MTNQEIITLISLFTLGLLGGFSHCIGMCGPFVLTQVGNRLNDIKIAKITTFKKLTGLALLPYHCGRIVTYCLIGFLSSLLANNIKNIIGFKIVSGVALIIAALIIFGFAVKKIKLPFKINLIKILPLKWVDLLAQKLKNTVNPLFLNSTGLRNFLLGILLGFIPCGLVYAAIAATLALNNCFTAAIAMLVFGIATIPALFLTGCGGYLFFDKIKHNLKLLTKIILLINATTLLAMAIGLIFNKI